MSEKELERGLVPTTSAGMIVCKRTPEGLRILIGERRNDPWRGYTICVFGGSVKDSDPNVTAAARREATEETGGTLEIRPTILIGHYGPQSFHAELTLDEHERPVAKSTQQKIHGRYTFVYIVYAGLVTNDGTPRDNDEVVNLRWEDPVELARRNVLLAFDQAIILADFYHKYLYDPNFPSPFTNWILTPLV